MCSAAVITFDCGAFATTTPRLVAATTSTLSTPTPARPTARSRSARASSGGVELRRRPDQNPVELADPLLELLARPPDAQLDVEVLTEQLDARIADVLGHQHAEASGFVGGNCGQRGHSLQSTEDRGI